MAKYSNINSYFCFFLCFTFLLFIGCDGSKHIHRRLDCIESLMEDRPDSALILLSGIVDSELYGAETKARYALLKSMALDKNYIDTTSFEVLQPAIDYYLKNGNPDQKLRTYYYQGRIYENAGADDLAMQAYLDGLNQSDLISDSLTFARMLVAQGALYYKEYLIDKLTDNNLKAAEIYRKLGKQSQQLKCYIRALHGTIILRDRHRADSIMYMSKGTMNDSLTMQSPSLKKEILRAELMYYVNIGNAEEIKEIIEEVQKNCLEYGIMLNLAMGYSKIGCPELGLRYLNEASIASDDIHDSLSYWSVKTCILENLNSKSEALESYRNYSRLLEDYHIKLFRNELLFSEKKHEIEMENMASLRKRDSAIRWILACSGFLLLITILIYYRYRMNKAGRQLAESNNEKLQLESEKQRLLTEKLESERAQLSLEAENLNLHISQLEAELERLKELLNSHDTLSEESRQVIRERIDMLNGLFAEALTDHEPYGKKFRQYVQKIKKDRRKFQESTLKVLEATHPEFMAYLREHGLTEREIEYVCLYAIGLRGKEIGSYINLARHYNISSEIRRKLGLENTNRNLGPFIQEMMEYKGKGS